MVTAKFLKNDHGQTMQGVQGETENGKAKGQTEFKTNMKIFRIPGRDSSQPKTSESFG
jgi:hypothetical protein